jgi:peptide/nickel transport system permease protein
MTTMQIPAGAGQAADPGQIGAAPTATERAAGRIWRAIRSNKKAATGAVILIIFGIMAVFPGQIAHDNPEAFAYGRSLGPSLTHLLGTTANGQDIFAQVVWGARETMIIALVSGILSTLLSMIMGIAAAYLGGLWDHTLNFITDILLIIPTFPLLIVIIAYYPHSSLLPMIAVLVITGYSYGARQLRAEALALRSRDFLEAARVRGERKLYIIFVEIIPSMTSLIMAVFLGTAMYNVIAAAGLQFIGFGDPNSLSWGTMLYWAQNGEALQTNQYLWAIAPGLCIALLGAAFALLNYAFDEIGNPALQRVKLTNPRGRRFTTPGRIRAQRAR